MGRIAIQVVISTEAFARLRDAAARDQRKPWQQAGWMLERMLLGDEPAQEAPARRATRKGGG